MSRKFIIDVPDGETACAECPFQNNTDVCEFIHECGDCKKLNFAKLHIEEYEEL